MSWRDPDILPNGPRTKQSSSISQRGIRTSPDLFLSLVELWNSLYSFSFSFTIASPDNQGLLFSNLLSHVSGCKLSLVRVQRLKASMRIIFASVDFSITLNTHTQHTFPVPCPPTMFIHRWPKSFLLSVTCMYFLWCPSLYPDYWNSNIEVSFNQASSVNQQVLQCRSED